MTTPPTLNASNDYVELTGASRLAQCEFGAQRRLAPAAHAGR
jgi:hypothetical protein